MLITDNVCRESSDLAGFIVASLWESTSACIHQVKADYICSPCLLFVSRLAARWLWPCSCIFWRPITTGSSLRVCTSTASSSWPSSQTESIYGDLLWLAGVSLASLLFCVHARDYNMNNSPNAMQIKHYVSYLGLITMWRSLNKTRIEGTKVPCWYFLNK